MKASANIQIRYTGIHLDNQEIPGICLCFNTRSEAEEHYAFFHKYITSPGGKKIMNIRFQVEPDSNYRMELETYLDGDSLDVLIRGIDEEVPDKIKVGLEYSTYYAVLAGYGNSEEFQMLPPSEYHLFKRDIFVNGENILGVVPSSIDFRKVIK